MWVIYRKKDQKVMGMSAHSAQDLPKDTALEEVVKGWVKPGKPGDYDAIQVTDHNEVARLMNALPEKLVIKKGKKEKLEVGIEEPTVAALVLRSDAPDVHPVDGIPEIPGDGSSYTTITIQKVDAAGQPLQGKEDNDLLYLRTTHGTLFSGDGKKEITSIKLVKGAAAIRLVSEKAKRIATVDVFNADQSIKNTAIRIEFI